MTSEVYMYCPLIEASKQIRLLRILPDGDSQPIRVTLEIVGLDEWAGKFDALSYTWGGEDNLQRILIDGKVMTIRCNLWSFLQHHRSTGRTPRPIWTDAVCINQQDIPEKNVQVAKMGDLYRAADRVLIWLGTTSDLSNSYGLNQTGQVKASWLKMSREPNDFFIDRIEGRKLSRPLSEEDAETLTLLDHAMSIVYNSYWRRMWIVQEALLANSLRIILGDELLDDECIDMIWTVVSTEPEELFLGWMKLRGQPNDDSLSTATLQNNPMLWVVIENTGRGYMPDDKQHKQHSTFDFNSMLHFFGKSLCFNPRDRVYSLLGLTQATSKLKVDYTCSLEELFADALQCMGDEAKGFGFPQVQKLVQALGITKASCLEAMRTLPMSRANSLLEVRAHMQINIWGLVTRVSARQCEDISEHSNTIEIYSSRTDSELFLLTDFATENGVVQTWHEKNWEVLLVCSLGTWPSLILNQDSSGRVVVDEAAETYQLRETDNVNFDSYRVRRCPPDVRESLNRALNIPRLDWQSIFQGNKLRMNDAYITLSALEIINLYDLFSNRSEDYRQQDEAFYV